LLPIVSFAADGAIAIGYFVRLVLKLFLGTPVPPSSLAKARSIDLAIQFVLFWMPFMVLLGWWTGKPMSLLFGVSPSSSLRPACLTLVSDLFDVSVLLGACFLVNYVTADKKTNWIEGIYLIADIRSDHL
jgi:Ca2+:H+ antiporter